MPSQEVRHGAASFSSRQSTLTVRLKYQVRNLRSRLEQVEQELKEARRGGTTAASGSGREEKLHNTMQSDYALSESSLAVVARRLGSAR